MPDFILKTGLPLILKLISNMKHLENAPNTRRMIWGFILVALWYGLPALISSVRWW